MESIAQKLVKEKEEHDAIREQIAALQARLPDENEQPIASPKSKRKSTLEEKEKGVLVPGTPSPRKKRKTEELPKGSIASRTVLATSTSASKLNRHGHGYVKSHSTSSDSFTSSSSKAPPPNHHIPTQPAPSKLIQKLASLNSPSSLEERSESRRTSSFADAPALPKRVTEIESIRVEQTERENREDSESTPKRDDNLAIIQSLEPGPLEHKPSFDDPHFERLEPNSGIRLSSRNLPHALLQEHLSGRFYLSPSTLYACVTLLPDKSGYDVPVDGDWITIAVVAERGEIKWSRAPVGIGKEEDEEEDEDDGHRNGQESGKEKWKKEGNMKGKDGKGKPATDSADAHNTRRRRYVNIKLIDFGARSSPSSSASKPRLGGDAFLSLLLFEADSFELITEEGDDSYGEGSARTRKLAKPRKVYRGGSRGAFESMSRLKEGDVVALLNPKIMRPYTSSTSTTTNILAVTPTCADSITHIGRSLDLGMCTAVRKDGTVCGAWCDKRLTSTTGPGGSRGRDICDWHIVNAVQRSKAGRGEFTAGTTGMSSALLKRKFDHSKSSKSSSSYDPIKKIGLLPANLGQPSSSTYDREIGATYVVSGHVINNSNASASSYDSTYITENMGRQSQARAQREQARRAEDKLLEKMLRKDVKEKGREEGEGHMRSVLRAREVVEAERKKDREGRESRKGLAKEKERKEAKRKGKRTRTNDDEEDVSAREVTREEEVQDDACAGPSYRPEMIKSLGFDPVAMKLGLGIGAGSQKRQNSEDVQRKLDSLNALQKSRKDKEPELGPRPGKRVRSGVVEPTSEPTAFKERVEKMRNRAVIGMGTGADGMKQKDEERMIDLDSSDED